MCCMPIHPEPSRLSFGKALIAEATSTRNLRLKGKMKKLQKLDLLRARPRFDAKWKDFAMDNKLKLGDACVFEVKGQKLVRPTQKLLLPSHQYRNLLLIVHLMLKQQLQLRQRSWRRRGKAEPRQHMRGRSG